MNNKQLVIGVIACFAISILFLLVIVWEIKKSIDHDAKIRKLQAQITNLKELQTEQSVNSGRVDDLVEQYEHELLELLK